jgi:hypothetical protein
MEVAMTDISITPSVAAPVRAGHVRSPFTAVANGARRVWRSYNEHLATDAYIVPNGQLALAARQASATR